MCSGDAHLIATAATVHRSVSKPSGFDTPGYHPALAEKVDFSTSSAFMTGTGASGIGRSPSPHRQSG